MSNVDEAISALFTLSVNARFGHEIDQGSIEHIIDLLQGESRQDDSKEKVEKTLISDHREALRALKEASGMVDDIRKMISSGHEVHEQDLLSLRSVLDRGNAPESEREGVVITKNEGIIVCVTWQNGEGQIQEVLAESCGYPEMKEREKQALETIQNLVGAFDNPITRRKSINALTAEAIEQGKAYIEQHKPDDEIGGL